MDGMDGAVSNSSNNIETYGHYDESADINNNERQLDIRGLDANNENMNVAQSNPPIKSAVSDSSKDMFSSVSLLSYIHKIESPLHKETNVSTVDEILKVYINKKKRIREVVELARRLRDDFELFQDRHRDFLDGEDLEED
jgi:hypothetical protein